MRYFGIMGIVASGVLANSAALAAGPVTHWNDVAVRVGRNLPSGPAIGPNSASRIVAVAQLAVYEAVNSVAKSYQPYRSFIPTNGPVSLEAAVAQAAHDALVTLQPAQAGQGANLDHELSVALAAIADGEAKQNGIQLGALAAASIVALRINDGSAATVAYPGSTDIGKWRPTVRNPEFTDAPTNLVVNPPLAAADPQWADLKPFGLLSPDQFRTGAAAVVTPPPALTSAEYAAAFNEVKILGAANAPVTNPVTDPPIGRSTEQTRIANFWAQQTHVPFNAIARSLSDADALSIAESARLFALLNIALADSRATAADAKYEYGFWRPATAIRAAADDGNDLTEPDLTWNSLLDTPNHPEFPSGHSATGAAGAGILRAWFGDARPVSVASLTLTATVRNFSSMTAAAQENADSRVYGGIHFRFSNDIALGLGYALSDYVSTNLLQALPPPGGEGGAGGEGGTSNSGEAGSAGEDDGDSGEGGAGAGTGGSLGGSSGRAGSGGAGRGGSATGSAGEDNEAGAPSAGSSNGGRAGAAGGGGRAGSGARPPVTPKHDEDCSCSTPGRPVSSPNAAWLALLGLAALGRRRWLQG
jgi:MYXO-CTERM domain-containing protein